MQACLDFGQHYANETTSSAIFIHGEEFESPFVAAKHAHHHTERLAAVPQKKATFQLTIWVIKNPLLKNFRLKLSTVEIKIPVAKI